MSDAHTSVGPHKFTPMRLWDLRGGGRCRACFLPMNAHPVHCWVPSRPLGDKSKAELSWQTLHVGDKS